MTTIYGIKNCDSMKKAFAWLDEQGIAYTFHDYKKLGIDSGKLHEWSKVVGWKTLLNTRGTTWRKLPPEAQAAVTDAASAAALLQREPSAIKRPVVEWPGGAITVGFAPGDWAARIG